MTDSQDHRSAHDIEANMLQAAMKVAITKTELTHASEISYTQAKTYIKELLDLQLLALTPQDNNRRSLYKTTPRGKQFIDVLLQLEQLLTCDGGTVTARQGK